MQQAMETVTPTPAEAVKALGLIADEVYRLESIVAALAHYCTTDNDKAGQADVVGGILATAGSDSVGNAITAVHRLQKGFGGVES